MANLEAVRSKRPVLVEHGRALVGPTRRGFHFDELDGLNGFGEASWTARRFPDDGGPLCLAYIGVRQAERNVKLPSVDAAKVAPLSPRGIMQSNDRNIQTAHGFIVREAAK
ncbi:hypothetical protein FRC10_002310 [Ceratobasidium sp. 414]|nr:hypothetical protein FRC10_002310 [Ceratobasidium sp. 414]